MICSCFVEKLALLRKIKEEDDVQVSIANARGQYLTPTKHRKIAFQAYTRLSRIFWGVESAAAPVNAPWMSSVVFGCPHTEAIYDAARQHQLLGKLIHMKMRQIFLHYPRMRRRTWRRMWQQLGARARKKARLERYGARRRRRSN
jgi:hypothetical protein